MNKPELGESEEVSAETSSPELSPSETAASAEADETPQMSSVEASEDVTAGDDATAEVRADEAADSAPEAEAAPEAEMAEAAPEADAVPVETAAAAAASQAGAGDEEDYAGAAVDESDHEDDRGAAEQTDDGRLKRGALVEGVVLETSPTSVSIELADGVVGYITSRELELMPRKMLESLTPGAQLMVYVVNPKDHQGNVLLSINRAAEEMDWHNAEELRRSKEVYEGKIAGYNKGGLIVRFGRLRGFLPHSQVSEDRIAMMVGETPEERYGSLVNGDIAVKVMEVDRGRNRLILSERAAMREVRQRRKEVLIGELKEGEIREGVVVSLEDFGAFVNIGGAEGLIHLTELSWSHLTHPRQVLSIGQRVKVRVISVDEQRNRIGLSLKQLDADPWDQIATSYQIGQLVQAEVTKLTKFGAFARLTDAPEVEGLIHISELSDQRVSHPREVAQKGDTLTLRVVKIDVRNRRLGLSLKRVNSAEYLDFDMQQAFHKEEEPPAEESSTDESED